MKKILVVLASVLCLASMNAAEYKHSVGVVVGGMNGISYKGFLFKNPKTVFQADLAVGLLATRLNSQTISLWDFTFNPNFMYEDELGKGFSMAGGGGFSAGIVNSFNNPAESVQGKLGLNAFWGVDYKVPSAPVVIGLDFRPGYAVMFGEVSEYDSQTMETSSEMFAEGFFDWKLALSVRYCF